MAENEQITLSFDEENDDFAVCSVSEVNEIVADAIARQTELRDIAVRGELSNVKRSRGKFGADYLYFTLKDEDCQLSAVMFEGVNQIPFEPKDGVTVVCEGMVTVYQKYGRYQLKCYSMSEDGAGAAARALEELRKKLESEGLFAQKREIPAYPKKIAVITSDTGAAVGDIIHIIRRRYPIVEIKVIRAAVQGENAVPTLVRAFSEAQDSGADVVIFGRGGGSAEDLNCFNSETLARAIFASKIPTISAIGHNIDFTIADRVADKYAITPSEAAMLAVPDIEQILSEIRSLCAGAKRCAAAKLDDTAKDVKIFRQNAAFYSPSGRIERLSQELLRLREGIFEKMSSRLGLYENFVLNNRKTISESYRAKTERAENELKLCESTISALNPLGVLARGYSMTTRGGRLVRAAGELSAGDRVEIKFGCGRAAAEVTEVFEESE